MCHNLANTSAKQKQGDGTAASKSFDAMAVIQGYEYRKSSSEQWPELISSNFLMSTWPSMKENWESLFLISLDTSLFDKNVFMKQLVYCSTYSMLYAAITVLFLE